MSSEVLVSLIPACHPFHATDFKARFHGVFALAKRGQVHLGVVYDPHRDTYAHSLHVFEYRSVLGGLGVAH